MAEELGELRMLTVECAAEWGVAAAITEVDVRAFGEQGLGDFERSSAGGCVDDAYALFAAFIGEEVQGSSVAVGFEFEGGAGRFRLVQRQRLRAGASDGNCE